MEKNSKPLALRHPLRFWFQRFVKGEDFEDSLHPVADIATVE
jgi:hypothetical protein